MSKSFPTYLHTKNLMCRCCFIFKTPKKKTHTQKNGSSWVAGYLSGDGIEATHPQQHLWFQLTRQGQVLQCLPRDGDRGFFPWVDVFFGTSRVKSSADFMEKREMLFWQIEWSSWESYVFYYHPERNLILWYMIIPFPGSTYLLPECTIKSFSFSVAILDICTNE